MTSETVPDTYIRLALMHQTKVRNASNFNNVFSDRMPREDLARSLPESLIYLNYNWLRKLVLCKGMHKGMHDI